MKISELLFEETEDIESIAKQHGFSKGTEKLKFGDQYLRATILSGNFTIGGVELFGKYIINPETSSWTFRVGLPEGRAVEMKTGEDSSSLIKHLKRKKKITPHQVAEFIPPLDS